MSEWFVLVAVCLLCFSLDCLMIDCWVYLDLGLLVIWFCGWSVAAIWCVGCKFGICAFVLRSVLIVCFIWLRHLWCFVVLLCWVYFGCYYLMWFVLCLALAFVWVWNLLRLGFGVMLEECWFWVLEFCDLFNFVVWNAGLGVGIRRKFSDFGLFVLYVGLFVLLADVWVV